MHNLLLNNNLIHCIEHFSRNLDGQKSNTKFKEPFPEVCHVSLLQEKQQRYVW